MSLSENIYKHRSAKGWSQTELADALDVSRQSVSKWENGSATPDLDKLIKMRDLFEVSLDTLVFGEAEKPQKPQETLTHKYPSRVICGMVMLVFGMVLFLLSIFWGNNLYFGEEFGELLSSTIVLISLALMAPYNFTILKVCMLIYFIYSIISFGILNISNYSNYIFMFIASIVLVAWFIVCGMHETSSPEPSGR